MSQAGIPRDELKCYPKNAYQFPLEVPKSILPAEFDLDVDQVNIEYFDKFSHHRSKESVRSFAKNENLYRINNQFILLDEDNRRVIYYTQWKDKFYPFIGRKAASEIKLWRGGVIFAANDISQEIFFKRILPIHGAIICDMHHTGDGERFWIAGLVMLLE